MLRFLKSKGIDADVISYRTIKDLVSSLSSIINKPSIALNFGESILSAESTAYADYIR
ncbi:unnamed protein product, partial [marine sediment metagenome]